MSVLNATNKRRMNAEEILNAVSSSSDEDDNAVAQMVNERLMGQMKAAAPEEHKAAAASLAGKGGAGGADYDFYLKNMNDPAVREKFIDNALLMSSSDEEDGDDNTRSPGHPGANTTFKSSAGGGGMNQSKVRKLPHTPNKASAGAKGRTESAFKVQQNLSPVVIVEQNERQSQHMPEKMMEAAS